MPTVVLHIGHPSEEGGRPSICLKEFDLETGHSTLVPGTAGEIPDELVARCDSLLDELRTDGGQPAARVQIGAELYRHLEDTSAGKEWFRRCQASGRRDRGRRLVEPELHTYLHVEPESLQRLPWELMTEAGPGNLFAPFRSANHFPARGKPSNQSDEEVDSGHLLPLSILVVIYDVKSASTPDEEFRSEPQAEVDAIFTALRNQPGIWQVEVLRQPTEDKLRESLETLRPQILHIIGETIGQDNPAFKASPRTGQSQSFEVADLERILFDIPNPRLIVLNGCRTADMASLESFGNLGARAVITNQAVVYGPPAITFTEEFYRELTMSGDVAKAVWKARTILWRNRAAHPRNGRRDDPYHWGIPVLTLYDGPGTVIRDLKDVAEKALAMISTGEFGEPELHFDRLPQSRQVWSLVRDNPHKRIALICGPEGAGKSLLMHTCRLTWKLCGHPAILFDAWRAREDDDGLAGTRKVIQKICEGLAAEFEGMPQVIAKLNDVRDALDRAGRNGGSDYDRYEKPCQLLISALEKATTDRPLMLAIDALRDFFREDLRGPIKKYIFRPIARGEAGNTYLIIAARNGKSDQDNDERWLEWWESDLTAQLERVELKKLSQDEAIPFAHEFGSRLGWFGPVNVVDGNARMAKWIKRISESADFKRPWSPVDLRLHADDFEVAWRGGINGASA